MAEVRNDKNRYPSRYGATKWITAHQWLAELMCERRAKKEKKTLCVQFWKTDKHWAEIIRREATAAARLISRLDERHPGTGARSLSRVLKTERGKTIYSLSGAWIWPLVEAAQVAIVALDAGAAKQPLPAEEGVGVGVEALPTGARPAFVPKKSLRSKLEEL